MNIQQAGYDLYLTSIRPTSIWATLQNVARPKFNHSICAVSLVRFFTVVFVVKIIISIYYHVSDDDGYDNNAQCTV